MDLNDLLKEARWIGNKKAAPEVDRAWSQYENTEEVVNNVTKIKEKVKSLQYKSPQQYESLKNQFMRSYQQQEGGGETHHVPHGF